MARSYFLITTLVCFFCISNLSSDEHKDECRLDYFVSKGLGPLHKRVMGNYMTQTNVKSGVRAAMYSGFEVDFFAELSSFNRSFEKPYLAGPKGINIGGGIGITF